MCSPLGGRSVWTERLTRSLTPCEALRFPELTYKAVAFDVSRAGPGPAPPPALLDDDGAVNQGRDGSLAAAYAP